ncbi:PTS sugar transporter subunit IIA [Streptococcus suis]
MHIGMDTVNLEGKGFTAHVKQGQTVKAGDKLISFDLQVIKDAGLVAETPVIITNHTDFDVTSVGSLPREIAQGEAILTARKN